MAQQPLLGQGLLIIEASRSHSDTPHSVGPPGRGIGPTQRPVPGNTQHTEKTATHAYPVGFEPAIPASKRPQTHALDRAATGVGRKIKLPR